MKTTRANDNQRDEIFTMINAALEETDAIIALRINEDTGELQTVIINATYYEIAASIAGMLSNLPQFVLDDVNMLTKVMRTQNET